MNRFETLLVEEIPSLRRYARALCGDPAQADDLVQECLLRAINRRKLWIGSKGIRPWLFTILHNIFVNTMRRASRVPITGIAEDLDDRVASADSPEELSTLSDFEKSLDRLGPEQREVLLLVGLEQLSYKEVAKIAGGPVGTVMSRLSRAREYLRKGMEGEIRLANFRRVK